MAQPLMPKATAVWLVENTALTFDQIADYCNLHSLEVQAIADRSAGPGIEDVPKPGDTYSPPSVRVLLCKGGTGNQGDFP